jgi:hypothetical protein
MIRTIRIGDVVPDLLHHGRLLPVGTLIRYGSIYKHVAPGVWRFGDRFLTCMCQLTSRLVSLPDERQEVTLPAESAAQFRWRLRDAAFGSAERSGVDLGPVQGLCEAFGAPTPRLTVGGLVSSHHEALFLPPGSLLYSGHPSYPERFGVFRVERRQPGSPLSGSNLRHVFGHNEQRNGDPMTIYSAPDLPVPEEEEAAPEVELAAIALRAWRVGKVFKRRVSWCGSFENSLAALGIDDASVAVTGELPLGVGDEVTREQAALLPEGSLLYHRWRNGSSFAVYLRDNSGRGTARTKRVAGYEDGRGDNSHEVMTVIRVPGEPMAWSFSGTDLDRLPDGVLYRPSHEVETSPTFLDAAARRLIESHWSYLVCDWPGLVA